MIHVTLALLIAALVIIAVLAGVVIKTAATEMSAARADATELARANREELKEARLQLAAESAEVRKLLGAALDHLNSKNAIEATEALRQRDDAEMNRRALEDAMAKEGPAEPAWNRARIQGPARVRSVDGKEYSIEDLEVL